MEFLTTSGMGDNRGKRFFGTTLFSRQPEVARTSAIARWKALGPSSKTSAGVGVVWGTDFELGGPEFQKKFRGSSWKGEILFSIKPIFMKLCRDEDIEP